MSSGELWTTESREALACEERTARMKRFCMLLVQVAGRMNRNNCVMGLRVCNNVAALQATLAKALGRPGG